MNDVTQILSQVEHGDPSAAEQLLPLVYDELRKLAAASMAQEKPGQTLQATALVHEAYLRLVGDGDARWDGRGHFFASAAEAMRRILIEHARAEERGKARRSASNASSLRTVPRLLAVRESGDLLELNEALEHLSRKTPARRKLVKLLYFAGLNLEEAAAIQGISRTTAYRHWTLRSGLAA